MSVHRIVSDVNNVEEMAFGGLPEGYSEVYSGYLESHRWSDVYDHVIRDLVDGTYWRYQYEVGATEEQEIDAPESFTLTQVEPYDKTVTAYREIA